MKSLPGGIDIGSENHHVIIMDDNGKILYDRKVAHRLSEFREAVGEFRGSRNNREGK